MFTTILNLSIVDQVNLARLVYRIRSRHHISGGRATPGAQPSAHPYPPPPGVRIVTTSPASRSRPTFGGSSSPLRRFSPTLPGSPPLAPRGGWRRRSVRREREADSRTRTERSMPSPPRCSPPPPEP